MGNKNKFLRFLLYHGFVASVINSTIFILRHGSSLLILLLYVDDIIFTDNNTTLLFHRISLLSLQFPIKDLGDLHYLLGVQVVHTVDTLFLSQKNNLMIYWLNLRLVTSNMSENLLLHYINLVRWRITRISYSLS